jgi:hypothetical protein
VSSLHLPQSEEAETSTSRALNSNECLFIERSASAHRRLHQLSDKHEWRKVWREFREGSRISPVTPFGSRPISRTCLCFYSCSLVIKRLFKTEWFKPTTVHLANSHCDPCLTRLKEIRHGVWRPDMGRHVGVQALACRANTLKRELQHGFARSPVPLYDSMPRR